MPKLSLRNLGEIHYVYVYPFATGYCVQPYSYFGGRVVPYCVRYSLLGDAVAVH
jgi:hypothetical protein